MSKLKYAHIYIYTISTISTVFVMSFKKRVRPIIINILYYFVSVSRRSNHLTILSNQFVRRIVILLIVFSHNVHKLTSFFILLLHYIIYDSNIESMEIIWYSNILCCQLRYISSVGPLLWEVKKEIYMSYKVSEK